MQKSAYDPPCPRTNAHLREDVLVVRLQRAHLHAQDALALRRQALDDVALEATEHERFELLVQFLDLRLMVRVREVELVRQRDYRCKLAQCGS